MNLAGHLGICQPKTPPVRLGGESYHWAVGPDAHGFGGSLSSSVSPATAPGSRTRSEGGETT
jgi:hypothetical protein